MSDLVQLARVTQVDSLSAVNTGGGGPYLASLITAASQWIQRYCARDFTQTSYSEYYSGGAVGINSPLRLRQCPVTHVGRVAVANRCMQVLNSGATAQRATVEVTSTGDLVLTTVISGATAASTIAAATYVTIQAVANQIAALGNGWSTAIYSGSSGSYALFPTTDLKPLQGAVSAKLGGCYLDIYEDWNPGSNTAVWSDDGEFCNGYSASWKLDDETGELYGHFPRGNLNLRVDYTAGYATIPQAVQEACVQLVQAMYENSQVNQAIKSAKLGDAAYTIADAAIPNTIKVLLSPYRLYDRVVSRN